MNQILASYGLTGECKLSPLGNGLINHTSLVECNGKKYVLHKVEKGQTLYAISKLYNITVNDIVVANPDAIDGIKAGQELRIPLEKNR